jgi:hypothetical protein
MADKRRPVAAPKRTDPLTYQLPEHKGLLVPIPWEPPPDIREIPPLHVDRLSKLTEEQQAKVMEIVSKLFPEKTASRRILKHLMEKPMDTEELADELAKEEYAPGKKYGGSPNCLMRMLTDIRSALKKFALTPEGISHPFKIEIPTGTYGKLHTFQVSKNIPAKDVHAVWLSHFENGKQTKIVIAGPPFVFTRRKAFIPWEDGLERNHWGLRLTERMVPGFKREHMKDFRRYISVQDVQAVSSVFSYLSARCGICGIPAPRFGGAEEGLENPAFNYLIVTCDPRQHILRKKTASEGGEQAVHLLRRWAGTNSTTYINGDQSSAVEAVCRFITDGAKMEALMETRFAERQWLGFPVEFDMTFHVRPGDVETGEQVGLVEYREMSGWVWRYTHYVKPSSPLSWHPRWS